MKVLILSTYEHSGGAAIAASRLMKALRKNGVEASLLCRRNICCGPQGLRKQSWTSIMERGIIWMMNGFSRKDLWATDIALLGQDVTHTDEFQQADVIHLHWVNQGFLSLGIIEKIIKSGKRVVWTMHDAWNTMGAYHLAIQRRESWLERWTWKRKTRLYEQGGISFVACSRWLREEAENSPLMSQLRVRNIPNPIDTSVFHPVCHADTKRVLFVAQRSDNPMKGIQYLDEAAKMLDGVEIVALGRDIPYIYNEKDMAQLYASVDAFVLPSLSENLPNTIMEAMACGTPCVGFDIGGIPEMIDHKQNGYVARYKDATDLAEGIRFVLDNRETLGLAARDKVMREYSEEMVAKRYVEVYESC